MDNPLVTIICICHNQGRYVSRALESVLNQTYRNIQLIAVDDGSSDDSVDRIRELQSKNIEIETLFIENSGICTAFNRGFELAKGQYISDLAADDYFHPQRIEKQIELFRTLPEDYGVVFTDAIIEDKDGNNQKSHFEFVKKITGLKVIPTGNIFVDLIDKYFVNAGTMLVKREVYEELGGYDETLSYEDFDFWIRSSENWKYAMIKDKLTHIVKLKSGLSSKMYKKSDTIVESTYRVCNKLLDKLHNEKVKKALQRRIAYEWRMAVLHINIPWVVKWYKFYRKVGGPFSGLIKRI